MNDMARLERLKLLAALVRDAALGRVADLQGQAGKVMQELERLGTSLAAARNDGPGQADQRADAALARFEDWVVARRKTLEREQGLVRDQLETARAAARQALARAQVLGAIEIEMRRRSRRARDKRDGSWTGPDS